MFCYVSPVLFISTNLVLGIENIDLAVLHESDAGHEKYTTHANDQVERNSTR